MSLSHLTDADLAAEFDAADQALTLSRSELREYHRQLGFGASERPEAEARIWASIDRDEGRLSAARREVELRRELAA